MAHILRTTDNQILITEGAMVMGDVTLAPGVNVWYNAVIRGDDGPIVIGKDSNVQDCAVIHEGVSIGDCCTVGHTAIVHGCTIGNNTLIGMGAIVLNGAVIGNDCIVGAGAVVTSKINAPDGSMILGNPAKIIRQLTPEEIQGNVVNKDKYLRLAREYRAGGPDKC